MNDVTDKEEKLKLLELCFDKAAIGIFHTDENGNIFSVNDYACENLGYSSDELCALKVFDIDPVITRERMLEIKEMLDAAGSATHETVHRRRDGSTFPVEITANLLVFQGKTIGISFVKDITERKRAEEALLKSGQMLMSILDNFPGVVYWKDRNSVYMGCNKNFSQAAGLSEPAEIVGKNDHELPWKSDAKRYQADDRQIIESGLPKLNIIEPLLHADGRVAWFETSKVPLFDTNGRVFAVLGSSNDITDRIRVEEALRMAHAELECRVRERTGQLTSLAAELSLAEERERRRIATELHDQVGQALVLGKLKLNSLRHGIPSAEFETLFGEIRGLIGRSIEDIRSLTFQLSPPLLYEVGFEAAVEWLAEELGDRNGLRVNFRDDGKKKPLNEETRVTLYRMVRELLINVVKHADAKRVDITIERFQDTIRVIVSDDGSGFDSGTIQRELSLNRSFGLFNIRHRTEYLGGNFSLESEIGRGTRSTITLPLMESEINRG